MINLHFFTPEQTCPVPFAVLTPKSKKHHHFWILDPLSLFPQLLRAQSNGVLPGRAVAAAQEPPRHVPLRR
jgi:hypothetical protein